MFEFLNWRPSFKPYERGVKRGDLLFERPSPFFDFTSKMEWLKFVVLFVVGGWLAWLCGVVAYFLVAAAAGGFVWNIMTWIYLFVGGWILFCILHLLHSLRFRRIADLTDVEFVSVPKAESLARRIMRMPENLTAADYNVLFSRYIWADVESEPFKDVTDWIARIDNAQRGGPAVSVGGGDLASSIGESIGGLIGLKYSESKIEEIQEIAGGVPSTQEIVKMLQTELVPKYRELLGERLMSLYLVFLTTQPPLLPYDKSTSRADMRRVANASDTKDVLDYLKPFSEKIEEA